MATKQITTWDEFKAALTETITENTTYELQNDIDVSGEVLSSTITIVTGSYLKTINGNDHKINGLTHYSTFGVFSRGSSVKIIFNNLHFTNFMLQTGSLLYYSDIVSSSSYYTKFNNCLFSGLTNRLISSYNTSYPNYTTFNKCSFNVQTNILLYAPLYTYMYNCYIIINPIQGLTTCQLWSGGSSSYYAYMSNCYVTGKLYISYNTSGYIIGGTAWNSSSFYNNVFNLEVHITNYSASTTYYWTAGSPPESRTCLYNADKVYGGTGTGTPITCGVRTNFDGLTDSQLKSRTYIQQNTNFPLYG